MAFELFGQSIGQLVSRSVSWLALVSQSCNVVSFGWSLISQVVIQLVLWPVMAFGQLMAVGSVSGSVSLVSIGQYWSVMVSHFSNV